MHKIGRTKLIVATILLATVVFLVDLMLPLGVAGGVPYVAVVLLCLWLPQRWYTVLAALACTGLTILGLFLSPAGGEWWKVLANRYLALFAIWAATMLSLQRKQGEEALRESETRFRSLIEGSIQGVVIHRDFKPLFVNQAYADIFGYQTPDDILRMEHCVLQHAAPHEHARLLDAAQALQRGEDAPTQHEYQGVRQDGSSVWLSNLVTVVSWEGAPAMQSTVFDITERKRAEERFRLAVESAPNAMVLVNGEGQIVLVNSQTEHTFGYDRAELMGQPIDILIPERFRSKHPEYLRSYFRDPTVRALGAGRDLHGLRKDGSEFPIEIGLNPIEIDEGVLVLSAIVDITERKRAEEALRQQRDWLNVTLSSIGDAVIATDASSTITFLNPVAKTLTGWTASEALGRPVDEVFRVINESTRQPMESPVSRVLREGTVVTMANHTALITRDGHEISIANSGAPIRSRSGAVPGAVLVFRDVTDQKQMEEALLRARKIESVGVLAGGIAHDFNNMLTALMGNISLAKMFVDPDDKVFARLMEAEKACDRAATLAHQLLTFSKGGSPVRHTVSIAELLTESTDFALRGSNVHCDLAIPADLCPVDVDAGQIHQVLHNVVLNAAQAMPDGGSVQVRAANILVRLGAALPLKEGRYITMSVQDHGCGIPDDVLPNIFDPYFTTKEHGSGLGLATAYSIITKHEGYITATSEVGTGTTVCIYLPASQQALVTTPDVPDSPLVGSGRILVMDDEEPIRELLSEMLTSLGYEADCTQDGTEAIALYQSGKAADQPFVAVILDITIPGGMGGKETLEHLRAIDPQVKALISSGYANDPIMANFAQYGFSGVVSKPYTAHRLSDALQRVLGSRVTDTNQGR
jgi:PAS domain S-box-containing protein